jgi:hypothetical protein
MPHSERTIIMDNNNAITYNGDRTLLGEQFGKILDVRNRAKVAMDARTRVEQATQETCRTQHPKSGAEAPSAPNLKVND